MAQINTRIILRNDSSVNWLAHENVVLLKGEVGIEFLSDSSCKMKIGDGVKTWKELAYFGGEQLLGDDKSILINGQIVSLKGFADAEAGAQPRKNAAGEIEWVVPSTETVDGLQQTVAGLQSDVNTLLDIIQPVGEVSLTDKVNSLEEIVNGSGEGSVDAKIDEAINDFMMTVTDNGTIDTVKELIDYVGQHGEDFGAVVAKLDTIEEHAQVNKLEKVVLGDSVLDIVEKAVTIPVANEN